MFFRQIFFEQKNSDQMCGLGMALLWEETFKKLFIRHLHIPHLESF